MTAVPPPRSHGGDAAHIAEALGLDPASMIDLSASMNPFAPPTQRLVGDLLRSDAGLLGRYPDPAAATDLLAAAIGVDSDRLVLTNGGAEAIALVAAEVPVGSVVEPEFSLYRRHLRRIEPEAPRWRSNPSNPSGILAGADESAAVWDEAFYPIATGVWTRGDDRSWRLGSLTKLWNCPGLRLGYLVAPNATDAERVRRRQPQWAVNGLALAAVAELLAATDLAAWHAALGARRGDFAHALVGLGYRAQPTAANWVLVDHPTLREDLAPRGIVVRDCTSFGLAGTYRVAVPHPGDIDRVVAAFAAAARA